MGIWQKITSTVKGWLGGGRKKKKEPPQARAVSSNPRSRSQASSSNGTYFNRRELLNSLRSQEKEAERVKDAFKAKKVEYKDIADSSKTERQKGLEDALNARKNKLKEIQDYAKNNPQAKKTVTPDPKVEAARQSRERLQKRLDKLKEEQREFQKETNNKYNTKTGDEEHDRKAYALRHGGYGNASPEVQKHSVKYHPTITSAARGAASGATFGATEYAISRQAKKDKERAEAEKYYQEHKNAKAEMAGEVLGSLASFGKTAAATDRLGEKAIRKFAPNAAEKLAGTKLIQGAAKRSVRKAVEKGAIEGATKDLVTQVGKDKAQKIVRAVGTDIVQNATTGLLYDFNKASAKYEIGSREWWKEMGESAAFNALITSGIAVGSGVTGGKQLVSDAVEKLAKDPIRKASAARTQEAVFGRANIAEDLLDRTPVAEGAYGDIRRGILPPSEIDINGTRDINAPLRNAPYGRERSIKNAERVESLASTRERLLRNAGADARQENRTRLGDLVNIRSREEARISAINKELDEVSDAIGRARNIAPQEEYEALLNRFDELMAERNALEESLGSSAPRNRVRTEPPARRTIEAVAEESTPEVDVFEPYKRNRLKENPEAVFDESRTAKAQASEAAEATTRDAGEVAETTAKQEKREPTMQEQARKAERKAENAINSEQVERNRNAQEIEKEYRSYNAELKEKTNGKFGMRKGVVSAGKGAPPKEQRRILATMGREVDDILKDNLDNADAAETVYSLWNAPRKEKAMRNSYAKASEDIDGIANKLMAKLDAFKADPDSGTGLKIEDVMDMIAVKQVYKDNGVDVPDELLEAFNRLIVANKTEHAQGLSVIEQILREFDPEYRKAYIRKDFDKYLSRFGNADSWDEVAASLDRQHNTTGYLQDKLQELVDFDGDAEEYKKLYAELQKEVLRNAKPSLWNVLDAIRHTFMLSNFATAGRNLYGNISQRLMYDIADKSTEGFENIIEQRIKNDPEFAKKYADGFERTTKGLKRNSDNWKLAHEFTNGKLGEKLSKKKGYLKESDYLDELRKIVDEDVTNVMGYEKLIPQLEKGMDYVPTGAGEKLLQKAYRGAQKGGQVVSFMLNEPDSWFVERNYRSALAKYLEANGVTDLASLKGNDALLKRAREHAKNVALENTYKKANRLTTLIERGRAAGKKKGANPFAKIGSVVLDTEVPYAKVPINMFLNNVNYSPIGVAKNGWGAYKAIRNGDIAGLQKAANELSKSLTGTGLMAIGFLLNCDENEQMDDKSWGVIANAADYLKKYGVRDNSVKVGDFNFNIADIGLGATQLLMGAAYADAINEMGGAPKSLLDTPEAILQAFGTSLNVMGDLSLLDNATQFIDAISANGDYETKLDDRIGNAAMQVLPSYVNQYIPNPLRAVGKGTATYDIDTGVRKGEGTTKLGKTLQRNVNNLVQGVPIANEIALPHKVDAHGNAVSTGLFPEGRDTAGKKTAQTAVNFADPLSTRRIKIPEADKIELRVKDDKGNAYVPKAFDENRTYKATIGKGDNKEEFDLTGKEREQAARSVKNSGKDMAHALVYSKAAFFGDSHGERAQQILRDCPEDEEKAREYLYNLPEFKKLKTDEERTKYMDMLYYGGSGNYGKGYGGRERASNKAVYVDIKGHTEDEFRFANDLSASEQNNYNKADLASKGVTKGVYADAIEAIHAAEHQFKNGKNDDTINGKINTVAGIKSLGLTPEENVAIYEAVRGNRRWKDWDGVSGVSSGYRRYGYGRRGWRHYGRGGGKAKAPAIKQSAFKAEKQTYKNIASSLKTRGSTSSIPDSVVKITPPKVKFKKYEV